MKTILLFLLVLSVAGCATDNPHWARVEMLGGTATVSAVSALVATAAGANETIVIGAGALGALIGHESVKAAQWEDTGYTPNPNIVVVGAPAYGGTYDAYGRVYGAFGPGYYGNRYGYGYPWRTPGYCYTPEGVRMICPSYYPSPAVVVTTVKSKTPSGPTVDNYLDSQMIHLDCKTGNWGVDGKCLIRFAPGLKEEQKICEANPKDERCPKGYNPGKWAQIYRRL